MSYINDNSVFAPSGRVQELSAEEVGMVGGGSRVQAVIKVIDWLGRILTVKAIVDALPEGMSDEEFSRREQARRPGAGG
jgi:hypothetical protein